MNSFVYIALLALVAMAAATDNEEYAPAEGEEYHKCVQIRDVEPCKEFPDGTYEMCDVCHLGFMVICKDHDVSVMPCEVTEKANGHKVRMIFDASDNTCKPHSSNCPTAL